MSRFPNGPLKIKLSTTEADDAGIATQADVPTSALIVDEVAPVPDVEDELRFDGPRLGLVPAQGDWYPIGVNDPDRPSEERAKALDRPTSAEIRRGASDGQAYR